jgi:hypothetical protein
VERAASDLSDQRFTEGKEDVAIVVSVLEDWILAVRLEMPAGGVDDLVVAVEGRCAGDEIEDGGSSLTRAGVGRTALTLALSPGRGNWGAGLDLKECAYAGAAVVKWNKVHGFVFGFLILSLRDTVTGVKLNRRCLLMLVAAGLLVGLAALVWHGPREPSYRGTSLSGWLRTYRPIGSRPPDSQRAADAVRYIGTKALPFLVSWIQEYEMLPPWKVRLRNYASRLGSPGGEIVMETIAKRELRALRAFSAFEILGEAAAPAIPELVRIANRGYSGSSPAAIAALAHLGKDALPPLLAFITNNAFPFRHEAMISVGRMRYLGTNAHPAVVLLIKSLSDPHLAPNAAVVLGSLRLESDITVPALVECTHSSQELLAMCAATSLGKFGASARPAVPELLKMLDDPSINVRNVATVALQQIAPEMLKQNEGR